VAAYGKDIDTRVVKFIHKPILPAKSPRPKAGKIVSKGFGFPQPCAGIAAQHFFQDCAKILVHSFVVLP
jgi:hypothetical protein